MTNRTKWRPEGGRDPVGCRWIIGDPLEDDSRFCQRRQQPGSSYCPTHEERCRERLPKAKSAA